MLDGLNAKEWKAHRVKFEEIVYQYDNPKIVSRWRAVVGYFDGLSKKNTKAESLAYLNRFFSFLPGYLREEFLRVRRDRKYEEDKKKVRLLKTTAASLDVIIEEHGLKNYDEAVSFLLEHYDGEK